MTEPDNFTESTTEPHTGSSRNPAPSSTEGDGRTLEDRLLARRRLGKAYLDDVRRLIAERDEWRETAEQLAEELAARRQERRPAPAEELSVGTIWSRHDERDG